MKSTQHIRTVLRIERSQLLGMKGAVSLPVRRTLVSPTGR